METVLLFCILGELFIMVVLAWFHSWWLIVAGAFLISLAALYRTVLVKKACWGLCDDGEDEGLDPDPAPTPVGDAAEGWVRGRLRVATGV